MSRINLLPQEERAKASRERGLIWAIIILVAVVAVLGLWYVKLSNDAGAKQDELAGVQSEIAQVQARIAELNPYAELQTKRTSMTETATAIYESSVPFSALLQQISLVIPDNVRLQSLAATVPQTMLPGGAVAQEGAEAPADITFIGQTEDHRDVAEFMTRLGLIPQLMDITLASSADANAGAIPEGGTATSYKSFTVTARLRPYTTQPPTTQAQTEVAQ